MTWPPLTDDEARVLRIVERQCRLGDPVATRDVKDVAGHRVDRQLAHLEAKGYVVRPTRGNWLPAPVRRTAPSLEERP